MTTYLHRIIRSTAFVFAVTCVFGQASGATIFTQTFDALSAPWTSVNSGGQTSFGIANGVGTLGPLNSATAQNSDTAYIQYAYNNSVTNYPGYTGSFVLDMSGLSFTPDATTGNNSMGLFQIWPTSGNNKLAELRFEAREHNNDYAFLTTNGVQFSSSGTTTGTLSLAPATLQALSNIRVDFVVTFANNGELNWTVSSDFTITNLADNSLVGTLASTITRNANNADFNPLTGSNERFRIGLVSHSVQFTAPNFTGNIVIDDFTVAGIPEPSTYGLVLALVLGAMVLYRRRR